MNHETQEGINHTWDHLFAELLLCVCGCGQPMTPGAEGLSLECGRKMWADALEEAAQKGDAQEGIKILGWILDMERAA